MILTNQIQNETSKLQIFYNILYFKKLDLVELSTDFDSKGNKSIVYVDVLEFYRKVFNDLLDYFSIINIHCYYNFVNKDIYDNFILNYSDVDYSFKEMSPDDKQRFGILNVYMLLKNGMTISKENVEDVYGEKMSNTKLQRIFKQIETVTIRKVITNKDLTYSFEKEAN